MVHNEEPFHLYQFSIYDIYKIKDNQIGGTCSTYGWLLDYGSSNETEDIVCE